MLSELSCRMEQFFPTFPKGITINDKSLIHDKLNFVEEMLRALAHRKNIALSGLTLTSLRHN